MALGPTFFPALNAFLNGTSAVLIGTGYYFIKTGRRDGAQAHDAHGLRHLDAVPDLVPVLPPGAASGRHALSGRGPLAAALLRHPAVAHISGGGGGAVHPGHALSRALKGNFARHKAIARYTFPIWMYVSVTGVVIYVMLYKIFVK